MSKTDLKTNAFVTLVMLDDGYIPGALVSGYSLRRQYPESVLICMVNSEVSSYTRDLLRLVFDRVIEVDKIFIPCKKMKETHYLPYVFTKLNALLLTSGGLVPDEISKVIFMDADVLPLKHYNDLISLVPPAGIINEHKSHFILVDESNQYDIKSGYLKTGKWHWHHIYDSICPHGQKIPKDITDRVKDNPENLGVHGALMVMEPSVDEFDSIMKDLENPSTKEMIKKFAWPEMQYLTLRWSGRWSNIDLKYCGFKGYPSMELLYGSHFAGVKPWKIIDSKQKLHEMPDYKEWYKIYLEMFSKFRDEFREYKKGIKLKETLIELGISPE